MFSVDSIHSCDCLKIIDNWMIERKGRKGQEAAGCPWKFTEENYDFESHRQEQTVLHRGSNKESERFSLFPVFISWIFECLCCLTKTVFGALSYDVELGKRCVLLWLSLISYVPIASLVPVRGYGHPWIILSVSSLYFHSFWKWPFLLSMPSANSTGIIEELVGDAESVCTSKMCLTYEYEILVAQMVKSMPAMWETWVWSLCQEYSLEKEMATHSSILDWKIPWTELPGGLQSMALPRVRHVHTYMWI